MISDAAFSEQSLCSELEKVRVECDQAMEEHEAAKEKACREGKHACYVEEENRNLQAQNRALEKRLQESQASGLKACGLLDQVMVVRCHLM